MKVRKRSVALLLALVLMIGILPSHASAAPARKLAAITFDDGPGPYTDSLLDGLAERGVPVTFFMQGYRVAQYSAVVKKAYEAGHQIASHTYSHPLLTKLSDEAIREQITSTASALNQATGTTNSYMVRPPYGSTNPRVLSALKAPAILWSVDTLDWKSLNADAVYKHIVNDTKDGSIILLHDIHATSIPGALRGIDALLEQGYELVTVSELLRRRGYEAAAGKKYFSAPGSTTLPGISEPAITPTESEKGRLVTLTADAGTTIYYTTDGTAPTSKSAVYTKPFVMEEAATIKAFAAYSLNGGRSQVAERTLDMPRVKTPVITLKDGMAAISGSGEIHYTLDGTAPSASSPRYTAPVPLPANTMLRAIAVQPGYRDSQIAGLLCSEGGNLFSDVQPENKHYQDIDRIVSQGLMTTKGNAFCPEQAVTRRETAMVLYRMAGSPDVSGTFSVPDVKDTDPARTAIVWAMSQNILAGFDDGTIQPDASVTREQLAVILCRAWAKPQEGDPAPTKLYGFADWKDIDVYAWDAVDWAVSSGVLTGISETAFAPKGMVTRAQLASIVLRGQAL